MKKKVAVVILNWNGAALLQRFLPSVCAHTPAHLADIVVADNDFVSMADSGYLRSL